MITANGVPTVADLEELVGPIDPVPCELDHPHTQPEASDYLVALCCSTVLAATCADHRNSLITRWSRATFIACRVCGTATPGLHWQRICRFEPIPKGRHHAH